jgi:hypothetical protein
MYFFAGSEVCLKVMPVVDVTSTSCGTGRPAHLDDLAPVGGGEGAGWPLCASAKLKIQNAIAMDRKTLEWSQQ